MLIKFLVVIILQYTIYTTLVMMSYTFNLSSAMSIIFQ